MSLKWKIDGENKEVAPPFFQHFLYALQNKNKGIKDYSLTSNPNEHRFFLFNSDRRRFYAAICTLAEHNAGEAERVIKIKLIDLPGGSQCMAYDHEVWPECLLKNEPVRVSPSLKQKVGYPLEIPPKLIHDLIDAQDSKNRAQLLTAVKHFNSANSADGGSYIPQERDNAKLICDFVHDNLSRSTHYRTEYHIKVEQTQEGQKGTVAHMEIYTEANRRKHVVALQKESSAHLLMQRQERQQRTAAGPSSAASGGTTGETHQDKKHARSESTQNLGGVSRRLKTVPTPPIPMRERVPPSTANVLHQEQTNAFHGAAGVDGMRHHAGEALQPLFDMQADPTGMFAFSPPSGYPAAGLGETASAWPFPAPVSSHTDMMLFGAPTEMFAPYSNSAAFGAPGPIPAPNQPAAIGEQTYADMGNYNPASYQPPPHAPGTWTATLPLNSSAPLLNHANTSPDGSYAATAPLIPFGAVPASQHPFFPLPRPPQADPAVWSEQHPQHVQNVQGPPPPSEDASSIIAREIKKAVKDSLHLAGRGGIPPTAPITKKRKEMGNGLIDVGAALIKDGIISSAAEYFSLLKNSGKGYPEEIKDRLRQFMLKTINTANIEGRFSHYSQIRENLPDNSEEEKEEATQSRAEPSEA